MGSSFEDSEIWKKSCRLSVHLYKLLRDCHAYGMKDQILRSSISDGLVKSPNFDGFVKCSRSRLANPEE